MESSPRKRPRPVTSIPGVVVLSVRNTPLFALPKYYAAVRRHDVSYGLTPLDRFSKGQHKPENDGGSDGICTTSK